MASPPIHRLAVAAQKHIDETGQQPQKFDSGTGYGCRPCSVAGVNSEIISAGRGFRCKGGGHTWADNDELVASNPLPMARPPKAAPIPANAVDLGIKVSPDIKKRLEERFGLRLNASAEAILAALLDPKAFIVSGQDAEEISRFSGQEIHSGSAAKGVIIQAVRERDQTRAEMAKLQSPAAGGTGLVTPGQAQGVVANLSRLSANALGSLRALALHKRKSVEDVMLEWMEQSLLNNWIN